MPTAADAATHVARLKALLLDPALRVPSTSLEHIQHIGERRPAREYPDSSHASDVYLSAEQKQKWRHVFSCGSTHMRAI